MFSPKFIYVIIPLLASTLTVTGSPLGPTDLARREDTEPSSTFTSLTSADSASASAKSAFDGAWAGVVASLVTSALSSGAPNPESTAGSTQGGGGDFGDITVRLDPFTCVQINDSSLQCNPAQAKNIIPVTQPLHVNGEIKGNLTFLSYPTDDTGGLNEAEPVRNIECQITATAKEKGDIGAIEVHTKHPFVKEDDPKNMLTLNCPEEAKKDIEMQI